MVVFTCNNCGESLQKPKVEKHYATVCRTVKNLTCVDCLKDFTEEAYAGHTKCVTEQERYSAKGSVTSTVRKGEAKQQQWSEMIEEVIKNNSNATGAEKMIFQIMSSQTENVPRKKMKFLNFVKNAGGNKIMYPDIESVWDLIEKYKNEQNTSATDKTLTAADSTTDELVQVVDTENMEPSKKKKKKKNKSESVGSGINPQDANDNLENASGDLINGKSELQVSDKKTKKKRKSTNAQEIENVNGQDPDTNNTNGKIKKKKKEMKNGTNVVETNETPEKSDEISNNNDIPKKKKKKLQQQDIEVAEKKMKLDDTASNEKKKKKKSKETSDNTTVVEAANGDSSVSDPLIRITLKTLQKKNSLPLTKLQKKVIGEYCKENNVTESPKLVKQFNKKVRKMKGVEVLDDRVILKTLDEC